MSEETKKGNEQEYSVVGLLLRLPIGMLFFFAGLGKILGGYGNFVSWIVSDMGEKTWLPDAMLYPYAYMLPAAELVLGALLLVGLCTRKVLFLTGLLLLSLMFGKVISSDHATVANIANYILIVAVAYYFNRYNLYSLDTLLKRKSGS